MSAGGRRCARGTSWRGRGLWGVEPPGTPTPPQATPEPEGPSTPDLAAWKQRDYAQMAHDERIRQADEAFDAEVGETLSPGEIYRLTQGALAAQIEQAQQTAREICAVDPGAAYQIAWEQANQRILGITLKAASSPQLPSPSVYPKPHPLFSSTGIGVHFSAGIGTYVDVGMYLAWDNTGDVQVFLFFGGGGTTSAFAEITPVFFFSNAPLEKWPGWSVNVGGSVEAIGSVGVDKVRFKDEQGVLHHGIQISTPGLGVSLPMPSAEFHSGATYTWDPFRRPKK